MSVLGMLLTVGAGVSLAATSDRLMLGNTAGVESALRPPVGQPLSESQSWQNAARLVPEQAWFVLYVNQRQLLDAVLELARHKDELAASRPAVMDIDTLILMDRLESLGPGVRDDPRQSTGETPVPPGAARQSTGETPVPPGAARQSTGETPVPPGAGRQSTGETPVPPGVARLRQRAGQAIYTLSTHPDGVRLTTVQLRPEK
jgi:hypothetical protein